MIGTITIDGIEHNVLLTQEQLDQMLVRPEFKFGYEYSIGTSSHSPLFIGVGIPPATLKYKCLIVNPEYRAEIFQHAEGTYIKLLKINES